MAGHIFTKNIIVRKADLDEQGHVNNVNYLRWVQELAKEHWLELSNKAINEAVYWVVLDHFIQYKHPAFLGEQLLVETYVENYSGPRSKRIVRFHNAAKKLVAIAETTWCMIDRSANKPKRVPEEIIDLFIPAYEEK